MSIDSPTLVTYSTVLIRLVLRVQPRDEQNCSIGGRIHGHRLNWGHQVPREREGRNVACPQVGHMEVTDRILGRGRGKDGPECQADEDRYPKT